MSKQSRAWLLQIPDKTCDAGIIGHCMDAIRNTGYFTKFYVATNRYTVSANDLDVQIKFKRDFGWSNNIVKALEYVEEDVFFMGCEDHLLVDYNPELIEFAFQLVVSGTFGCVRLTRKPQIKIPEYLPIASMPKDYRYYISLQPTVWSKEYLRKIIRPNETSWQFEILASQRAKKINPPAGVTYRTAFNYKNLIEKGKLVENPKDYVSVYGM